MAMATLPLQKRQMIELQSHYFLHSAWQFQNSVCILFNLLLAFKVANWNDSCFPWNGGLWINCATHKPSSSLALHCQIVIQMYQVSFQGTPFYSFISLKTVVMEMFFPFTFSAEIFIFLSVKDLPWIMV